MRRSLILGLTVFFLSHTTHAQNTLAVGHDCVNCEGGAPRATGVIETLASLPSERDVEVVCDYYVNFTTERDSALARLNITKENFHRYYEHYRCPPYGNMPITHAVMNKVSIRTLPVLEDLEHLEALPEARRHPIINRTIVGRRHPRTQLDVINTVLNSVRRLPDWGSYVEDLETLRTRMIAMGAKGWEELSDQERRALGH